MKSGLSGLGVFLACTTAFAADLASPRVAPVAFAPTPIAGWTGVYAGVQAGVGMSTARVKMDDVLDINGLMGRGLIGGLRLGADYQVSPSFVVGIIGTLDFGDLGGKARIGSGSFTRDGVHHDKLVFNPGSVLSPRWGQTASFATNSDARLRTSHQIGLRARLGYLVTPDTLVYVAPGFASAQGKITAHGRTITSTDFRGNVSTEPGDETFTQSKRINGWQLGVGFESRLSNNLSANFEYVYSSFRKYRIGTSPVTVSSSTGTFTAGLNYRYGVRAGASPESAAAAPASWTGLYAGLSGGAGIGGAKLKFGSLGSLDGMGATAVFGGAVLGYDYQIAPRWVIGAELGVDASSMAVKTTLHDGLELGNISARMPWLVTARVRAGYLVTPGTLLFAALGVSGGEVKLKVTAATGGGFSESLSAYGALVGLGGGFETAIMKNAFLRMEYFQTIMPDIRLKSIASTPVTIQPIGGAARMSLIYKL